MKKLISVLLACTIMAGALCSCSCGDNSANNDPTEPKIEELYKSYGFTKDDRRTEIKLDADKGINTKKVKNYIYDRMLNTYDYFDSLQATFYCVPNTGNAYYSAYCIQQGDDPRSKEITLNVKGEEVGGYLFDGKTATSTMKNDYLQAKANSVFKEEYFIKAMKSRTDTKVSEAPEETIFDKTEINLDELEDTDFAKLIKSEKRVKFSHVENRNKVYYRQSVAMPSMSASQYAPQSMTIGLLSQFKKWDITEEEELFSRPCYVIEGKSTSEYAAQMNIRKFELKVDRETGILLSVKAYNEKGKQVYQLTTYEFEVDTEIKSEVFA